MKLREIIRNYVKFSENIENVLKFVEISENDTQNTFIIHAFWAGFAALR